MQSEPLCLMARGWSVVAFCSVWPGLIGVVLTCFVGRVSAHGIVYTAASAWWDHANPP